MSACLAQQEPLKVAFLGPEGTFSQAAVLKQFGHSVRHARGALHRGSLSRRRGRGIADFGVVPVENSTEGTVSNTLDMLMTTPLQISGEVELRIRQHLLGRMGSLARCARCIRTSNRSRSAGPGWSSACRASSQSRRLECRGGATRRAGEGAAAIAGDTAAEVYGPRSSWSTSRTAPTTPPAFVVIGREAPGPSGRDKTSLLLSSRHKAGALQELLHPLSEHKVSMTRIESRPSRRGKWDYVFFVDVEGHREDANVAAALRDLETAAAWCRVLGSYPSAIL
jgi:chorismate mutase / prephenate dehydratase